MKRVIAGLLLIVGSFLGFCGVHAADKVPARPAEGKLVRPAADARAAARADLLRLLMRLLQPMAQPLPAGQAWVCQGTVRVGKHNGRFLLAWDGAGRQAVRIALPEYGTANLGFTPTSSWLFVPPKNVLFSGAPQGPAAKKPTALCRVWPLLRAQAAAAVMGAALAPLPDDFVLERTESGGWVLEPGDGKWHVRIEGKPGAGPVRVTVTKPFEAELTLSRWDRGDAKILDGLTAPPAAPGRERRVDDTELRAMLRTFVDMLCEKAVAAIQPKALPSHFPGLTPQQGKTVVVVRGTPEEMGRQQGTLMRTAVRDNIDRILHGVGFVRTVQSGEWLPGQLKEIWDRQRKWIPDDLVVEIDAMADAAGVPRDWARWANVYPEMFHCSGLALRGAATSDGRLIHGRVLDYMTEGGLQLNAVVLVMAPKGRNAWVNIGYAGCVGSVTAMNAKGLAMGEMGGGGEGYVDGIPMMFLVRQVMENYDNVRDALAWIRSVPRTCEYFYVLSSAKGKDMVGIASWAAKLAEKKGVPDLQVIEAGASHPMLQRPLKDCVLMSAGKRYQTLVDRVAANYGKITPEIAWKIMRQGVAMRSCLHVALFMPETLDFWVADAGVRGEPADTRPPAKFNLGRLLRASAVAGPSRASGKSAGRTGP
ncbi:MAG: hypothetical protein GXP31_07360 [Kiritimatiellaeota bacterium]|nr:hypothetical protein [Kiritimatiellota bacterium]